MGHLRICIHNCTQRNAQQIDVGLLLPLSSVFGSFAALAIRAVLADSMPVTESQQ